MPFLLARAAQVAAFTIEEEGGQRDETVPLARHLGRHGITARGERPHPRDQTVLPLPC